jgi:hypothetical protein
MKTNILAILIGAGLSVASLAPEATQAATWDSIHGNNRNEPQEHRARATTPAASPRGRETEPARRPAVEPNRGRPAEIGRERETQVQRGGEGERHEQLEDSLRERRNWGIDDERRHSYFWFGYHPGMVLNVLPQAYSQINVGGNPYYYDQGVYYQQATSGYVVVTPPVGAIVAQLPPGSETIPYGPTVYYYGAGAFYVQNPQGFIVVEPPPGLAVTEPPPNAQQVMMNGVLYYQADGVYFLPQMQNGVTVYVTARPS